MRGIDQDLVAFVAPFYQLYTASCRLGQRKRAMWRSDLAECR